MGVTNLQFDVFVETGRAHAGDLEEIFGIPVGIWQLDFGMEELWGSLENPNQEQVELSLALTSFVLQDSAAAFAAMDPASMNVVPTVTPYEWSIQTYRYGLDETILPTAQGAELLGPNVGGEIELFRREYAELEALYGAG
jgi:hypothetical protein